jgi:hypothetical protein
MKKNDPGFVRGEKPGVGGATEEQSVYSPDSAKDKPNSQENMFFAIYGKAFWLVQHCATYFPSRA